MCLAKRGASTHLPGAGGFGALELGLTEAFQGPEIRPRGKTRGGIRTQAMASGFRVSAVPTLNAKPCEDAALLGPSSQLMHRSPWRLDGKRKHFLCFWHGLR